MKKFMTGLILALPFLAQAREIEKPSSPDLSIELPVMGIYGTAIYSDFYVLGQAPYGENTTTLKAKTVIPALIFRYYSGNFGSYFEFSSVEDRSSGRASITYRLTRTLEAGPIVQIDDTRLFGSNINTTYSLISLYGAWARYVEPISDKTNIEVEGSAMAGSYNVQLSINNIQANFDASGYLFSISTLLSTDLDSRISWVPSLSYDYLSLSGTAIASGISLGDIKQRYYGFSIAPIRFRFKF